MENNRIHMRQEKSSSSQLAPLFASVATCLQGGSRTMLRPPRSSSESQGALRAKRLQKLSFRR